MSQLLEERQHQQEVIDSALAFQISRPLPQTLGQLLGAALEGEDPLIHAFNLSYYIYPEQVAIACDGRDDICVKPAI